MAIISNASGGGRKSEVDLNQVESFIQIEDSAIYESPLFGKDSWYKLYQGQKNASVLVTVKIFSKNLKNEAKQEWEIMNSRQYQIWVNHTDSFLEPLGSSFDPKYDLRSKTLNEAWKGLPWIAFSQLTTKCPNLGNFEDALKSKKGELGHTEFTEGDFIKLSILACDAFHTLEKAGSLDQGPKFLHGYVKPHSLNFKITATGLKVSVGNFFYSIFNADTKQATNLMIGQSSQDSTQVKTYNRRQDFWNYLLMMIELLLHEDPQLQNLKSQKPTTGPIFSNVLKLQEFILSSTKLSDTLKIAVFKPFFDYTSSTKSEICLWSRFLQFLQLYEHDYHSTLSYEFVAFLQKDGIHEPKNAPGFKNLSEEVDKLKLSDVFQQTQILGPAAEELDKFTTLDTTNHSTSSIEAKPSVRAVQPNPIEESPSPSPNASFHTPDLPHPGSRSEVKKKLYPQPMMSEVIRTRFLDGSKPLSIQVPSLSIPATQVDSQQQRPDTPHLNTPRMTGPFDTFQQIPGSGHFHSHQQTRDLHANSHLHGALGQSPEAAFEYALEEPVRMAKKSKSEQQPQVVEMRNQLSLEVLMCPIWLLLDVAESFHSLGENYAELSDYLHSFVFLSEWAFLSVNSHVKLIESLQVNWEGGESAKAFEFLIKLPNTIADTLTVRRIDLKKAMALTHCEDMRVLNYITQAELLGPSAVFSDQTKDHLYESIRQLNSQKLDVLAAEASKIASKIEYCSSLLNSLKNEDLESLKIDDIQLKLELLNGA